MSTTGVLVMAYGTPKGLDDVENYYTNILLRKPPQHLLDELCERYAAIGGRSPLSEITRAQADGLERRLDGIPVYLGQKFNDPFITDALALAAKDGVDRLIGLVLAPHYSSRSIGDYRRRAEEAAARAGFSGELDVIESWHLEPGYIELLARYVRAALKEAPGEARPATVVFTAHSLPEKILETGDPYPGQLLATAEAVAERTGLGRWRIGWQSAGRTADPWIGPGLLDVLRTLAGEGERAVIVCPCGFVADHLEVLYDIDIEAKGVAGELGLFLTRTRSPNDDPDFLDTLASVVRRALEAAR